MLEDTDDVESNEAAAELDPKVDAETAATAEQLLDIVQPSRRSWRRRMAVRGAAGQAPRRWVGFIVITVIKRYILQVNYCQAAARHSELPRVPKRS